ncbi:hypothetical protein NV379_05470 [Paenibacillus sp. N1-5-1-14]|uniref:hypothetical protein n=1 Tax=Paenibacillus radicibacter TaxID=2972488 RepID=UPI0021596FAE|nr:hypothetical protein [Paenibacillus radicibacter]MCR8642102.1 hypothetical protein [Paenibacillus radicibacter]
MPVKDILLLLIGVCIFLFFLILIILKVIERRQIKQGSYDSWRRAQTLIAPTQGSSTKQWLNTWLQRSYVTVLKIPLLNRYVLKIRRRIAHIHTYDEYMLRRQTMKISIICISIMVAIVGILLLFNQSISFIAMVLLGTVILNSILIDAFINRIDDRLLQQLVHLIGDVRHHYQHHGMVDESIYEASETASYEAAIHGKEIYEILTAHNPEQKLEGYYEVAPNRFLKMFASIAYLISEYGDKKIASGSLFLNGLTRLTNELKIEILKREKLNYLLKGLTAIAIAPVLFTTPIEIWARNNFPAMEEFYNGKFGLMTKILIFVIIAIAYILLRKMQENTEKNFVRATKKKIWEQYVERIRPMKWIAERFTPQRSSREYEKCKQLLKEANSPLTLEYLVIRRITLGIASFVMVLILFGSMHVLAKSNIVQAGSQSGVIFGKLNEKEDEEAKSVAQYDQRIMEEVKGQVGDPRTQVSQLVKESKTNVTGPINNEVQINQAINRIVTKMNALNAEYLKWWEVLIALFMGWIGYYAPMWLLYFQKKMLAMEMKNEVDQFHTVIAIFCEMERVSVETILESMERFASVFKEPLHNCLLHYEAGADAALQQLKEDAPFIPFARTVEKFQLAVEKIPIRQAFDDLESERNFYQEQRKQEYERMIDTKASWGKMIGFMPLYALVFLYLVIPLVAMSFNQMSVYYDQVNKIS